VGRRPANSEATIEPHGVRLVDLVVHADDRGAFTETFRRSWLPDAAASIVQANLSLSRAGVVRGMHFHRAQADYWVFLEGKVFVALFDVRAGSPTAGALETLAIDTAEARRGIFIPPGVAHGFYAITDVSLQYMVDAYYTGDDEHGFAWDDPEAAVPWPIERPVLSARDAAAPPLAEVRADAPPFDPVGDPGTPPARPQP
jgi:dTDP-4-dehydrorhamnose 3,5-epimerase